MKQLFCFRPLYFLFAIGLFITEVLIALYVHDSIVRPYGGDFLVVILVYCFARSFLRTSVMIAAIGTLLFSFLVEALQYINIVDKLGLQDSNLMRTVIGTSFAWMDILAYCLGIVTVLAVEWLCKKPAVKKLSSAR